MVRLRYISLILFCTAATAWPANEPALAELWKEHLAKPDAHEAAIKACRAFAGSNPNDPLLPVVQGIEAWHLFRSDRSTEAQRLIESHLTATGPIGEGARRLSLAWFTRLDRDKVAAALQLYYRHEVGYPKSLADLAGYAKLPASERPPAADRFGAPWVYQLTGFNRLRGFTDQKYSLQSTTLGESSDFKKALAVPYASRISATPAQVAGGSESGPAVRFNIAGKGAALIGTGKAVGELYLAYVGSQIIIVCDYSHWKVFPRP